MGETFDAVRNVAVIVAALVALAWLAVSVVRVKRSPRPESESVRLLRERLARKYRTQGRSYVTFEDGRMKVDLRGYLSTPDGQAAVRRMPTPPWPPGAVIRTCPHCRARYANNAECCPLQGMPHTSEADDHGR